MKLIYFKIQLITLIFFGLFLKTYYCDNQFSFDDYQNTNSKVHSIFYNNQNIRLQATTGCTAAQLNNIKTYVESCPQTNKTQLPSCIFDAMKVKIKQQWDVCVYQKNQTIGLSYWTINLCQVLLFGYGPKNYSYVLWYTGNISSNNLKSIQKESTQQFFNKQNKIKNPLKTKNKQNIQNLKAVCNTTSFNAVYNAIQLCTNTNPKTQVACIKNKLYQSRGQYWNAFAQTRYDYATLDYWLVDNCYILWIGKGQFLHDYLVWRTG